MRAMSPERPSRTLIPSAASPARMRSMIGLLIVSAGAMASSRVRSIGKSSSKIAPFSSVLTREEPPLVGLRRGIMGLLGVTLAALAAGAQAETYPNRPVRLIVPFPPGGSNDIVGRMIAAQLGERLGQQVIVDNRAGAGATIGAAVAASAPPDGYTLLLISASFVYNPALYKHLPYNPATAFEPVAM